MATTETPPAEPANRRAAGPAARAAGRAGGAAGHVPGRQAGVLDQRGRDPGRDRLRRGLPRPVRVRLDHGPELGHRELRVAVHHRREHLRGAGDLHRREPLRQHQARRERGRGARVRDAPVDLHDVRRGHGHRPDVLRCGRTALALLRGAAAAPARPLFPVLQRRADRGRARLLVLPLGTAPVGDLRGRRSGPGLLDVPQAARQQHERRVRAAHGRAALGPGGGGDDRPARGVRHGLRHGREPGPGGAAGRGGARHRRWGCRDRPSWSWWSSSL